MATITTIGRILGDDWLLPALDDSNRAYFTSGVLMVQACSTCGHTQHPPEDLCRACRSHDVSARECSGFGRVESLAVVHHAVHPQLKERVPYTVVLVAPDDAPGVRLVGNLQSDSGTAVEIGTRVTVTFEAVTDPASGEALKIPQWRIVNDPAPDQKPPSS